MNIEVQTHPDRIRRNEVIDLALLIHGNLRIARARRERPHHHRRAAFKTAHNFRNRIDIINREANDCGARTHPRQLARTRIAERRHPLAPFKNNVRHKLRNPRFDRLRPQKHGLNQPAHVQKTIRENMPALKISAQLYLIHRDKISANLDRHRFNRTNPVPRPCRNDLFLPRHQRHHRRPYPVNQPIINLARQ